MQPLARLVRVAIALVTFIVAAFALRAAISTLNSGSVFVLNDSFAVEPITRLRSWSAYSFGFGQFMLVLALIFAGCSLGVAAVAGTDGNSTSRRLLLISAIFLVLMALLTIIPVAVERP